MRIELPSLAGFGEESHRLTTFPALLDAVEVDAQEGVLELAAVEVQAAPRSPGAGSWGLRLQQIAQEQMNHERPEEGLRREHGMDGAQMLAGGMARQIGTQRAEERVGDVVLEDRGQLRVGRDLGNQRTHEVDPLAQEVEIGIVDPAGYLLERQVAGLGKEG